MTLESHVLLADRQRLAARDAQLQFDQVQPGDRLGDGMLDLQTGVHFHEIERAARIEQEFQRARAFVTERLDGGDRHCPHLRTQFRRHCRRRRLLDQLLMAPLHRAIALAEVNGVAVCIPEHLDLDVARIFNGALQDHRGIAERGLGFRARAAQRIRKGRFVRYQPHAVAAATGDRLDHHGKADAARLAQHRCLALVLALVAGDGGHAGLGHDRLGTGLVAHGHDGFGRGTDEHQASLPAGGGEILVLGEEAIAGMHGIGTAGLGRGDDRRNIQIGLRR